MLKTVRTEFIFAAAALVGLLSLAALINGGVTLLSLSVVLPAHGFLIWTLVKSDTDGFIKIHGMPRAGDPQREFHPLQSFILLLIAIAQVAIAAYQVLVG
jgi:hypothetical protein